MRVRTFVSGALALSLAACSTTPNAPVSDAARQLQAQVAAFAQPTHDARFDALKAQLDDAGLPYAIETFAGKRPSAEGEGRTDEGRNIVVRVGPAEGREILLTAHYDAFVMRDGQLAHGLVDNAASVVAVIEATKTVAGRTRHPVRLLLTDQEEVGLVGARAWIDAHGVDNLAAVINADVNGNGDTLMYGLNNGDQSAFLVTAVEQLCAARAMSCLDFPQYPSSDDRAFSAAGAPVISLGHQPRAEAEKMRAFLLRPPGSTPPSVTDVPAVLALIHTPNDNLRRIEAATLEQTASFIAALILKLDAELPLQAR